MEMKIDWKRIWEKFDIQIENRKSKKCRTCGHTDYNFSDWEDQQRKIQQLVNAQVRELVKKKT